MIKVLDSVSVPFWGYIFSNKPKMTNPLTPEEFPSPTGVIYSLIQLKKEVLIMISVSVLFWGYIFSNICTRKRICIQLLFPSPTGVLYSLILKQLWQRQEQTTVSVPFWGYIFSNMTEFYNPTTLKNKFPSPTGVLYSLIIYG